MHDAGMSPPGAAGSSAWSPTTIEAPMSPNGDTIEWRHGQAWSWAGAGPIRMGYATPAPTPTRLGLRF